MGCLPTGVTVVTSRRADGRPCGLTVNSVTSVSLDPLLVLVCLGHSVASHRCVLDSGVFAVSILGDDHEPLARRFAGSQRARRFDDVGTRAEVTGSPILDGAVGWLDCSVHATYEAGDHTIVVGEVLACGAGDADALVFYRGAYHRVQA